MSTPTVSPAISSSRLLSLDALRGFDMFWILGADALVQALGGLSDAAPIRFLAGQLDHKEWAGFAFYDLVFPLFVFIVGVSLVFSLTKTIEQHGRAGAAKRILRRAALLFLFGLFYNGGLSASWPDIRLVGVLQRIAFAYAAAGLLFCFCKPRVLVATCVVILAGYWALLTLVPIRDVQLDRKAMIERLGPAMPPESTGTTRRRQTAPDLEKVRQLYHGTTARVTGRYEPGLNLANHVDFEYLPGKKYDTYWDPEGLLSMLPAVATCLLGVFAGLLLRRADFTDQQKTAWLAGAGIAAVALGFLWGLQFPVIKKIWTSSFVLVAGGYSALLLGAFYYIVDVRQWRVWCQPFVWIGMNPITLYLAASVVSFNRVAQRFVGGDVKRFVDAALVKGAGDLVVTVVGLGFTLLLARFLFQRKIFLRV